MFDQTMCLIIILTDTFYIICFFSYDTEALNKSIISEAFINEPQFQSHTSSKLTYGIQTLYTIGKLFKEYSFLQSS